MENSIKRLIENYLFRFLWLLLGFLLLGSSIIDIDLEFSPILVVMFLSCMAFWSLVLKAEIEQWIMRVVPLVNSMYVFFLQLVVRTICAGLNQIVSSFLADLLENKQIRCIGLIITGGIWISPRIHFADDMAPFRS